MHILFDRTRLRKRRDRAAATLPQHDFMLREGATLLVESLAPIKHSFPRVAELGSHTPALATRRGTTHYISCDLTGSAQPSLVADEEYLPFAENALDAIYSNLSLQWVNDLPGTLLQIQRALKPDGLFMAVIPGAETLRELRQVLAEVESKKGGISPRVAPFLDVREAGHLLQRAGFALPVVDAVTLTVTYENLFALMHELRGMGASNMLAAQQKHFTPRGFFLDAAACYAAQHNDGEGRIVATVELLTLTGWKPAASQQKPAQRGSGKVSLRDTLS